MQIKVIVIVVQIVCVTRHRRYCNLAYSIGTAWSIVAGWILIQALQSVSYTLLNQTNVSDLILKFLSHVMEIQNTFMDLNGKISGAF